MPDIDTDDTLFSLDIAAQSFDVIRREEVVGANGRAAIVETVFPDVIGSVQPLGDNSLLRQEAFTAQNNAIQVWCKFPLFGVLKDTVAGKKYQPDIVRWNGDTYEVKVVDNWQGFGRGMSHAECMAFEYVQEQP